MELFNSYSPPDWHEFFMKQVFLIAQKSKDTRTKIGSVYVKDNRVLSQGYNGMPPGVNDKIKERYERPLKYKFFSHAERAGVANAAKFGIALQDSILYTNGIPCENCMHSVIGAGVKTIYILKNWIEKEKELREKSSSIYNNLNESYIMAQEAKVDVLILDYKLNMDAYLDGYTFKV